MLNALQLIATNNEDCQKQTLYDRISVLCTDFMTYINYALYVLFWE